MVFKPYKLNYCWTICDLKNKTELERQGINTRIWRRWKYLCSISIYLSRSKWSIYKILTSVVGWNKTPTSERWIYYRKYPPPSRLYSRTCLVTLSRRPNKQMPTRGATANGALNRLRIGWKSWFHDAPVWWNFGQRWSSFFSPKAWPISSPDRHRLNVLSAPPPLVYTFDLANIIR